MSDLLLVASDIVHSNVTPTPARKLRGCQTRNRRIRATYATAVR
jgi:hypothetical protein